MRSVKIKLPKCFSVKMGGWCLEPTKNFYKLCLGGYSAADWPVCQIEASEWLKISTQNLSKFFCRFQTPPQMGTPYFHKNKFEKVRESWENPSHHIWPSYNQKNSFPKIQKLTHKSPFPVSSNSESFRLPAIFFSSEIISNLLLSKNKLNNFPSFFSLQNSKRRVELFTSKRKRKSKEQKN